MVGIVRKCLRLEASLYETLQIVSLTMFETTPLHQLLTLNPSSALLLNVTNQLNLFESYTGHFCVHRRESGSNCLEFATCPTTLTPKSPGHDKASEPTQY